MGGYYVPNIQRPGFGYQRRSEDDDDDQFGGANDWGGDGGGGDAATAVPAAMMGASSYSPLAPSSPAAPTSAVPKPDYWPSGADWMGSTSDNSATPLRGGAGEAPTNTEVNQSQQVLPDPILNEEYRNLGSMRRPEDAYGVRPDVNGSDLAGFGSPAKPAASALPPKFPRAHTEEEKLKQMLKQGPKRSILGTIASAATGFGVGYVNAAGRTRPIPVPTQAMRDMTWRAPGGGAWDTKLARQKGLAEQEQGEEKRALTAQQVEAQSEERRSQADYYKQHGEYLKQTATTAAKAEVDRQKQQELQRIIGMGGRTPQIRYFPAGAVPKDVAGSSDWYIRTDPGDPAYKIAVRPNPGDQIDDETAEILGIPKGSFVPPNVAASAAKSKVALANAGKASSDKEAEELRRRLADAENVRHHKEMEGVGASNAANAAEATRQRQADADQKMSDAIDAARGQQLTSAKIWENNARNKKTAVNGLITPAEEAEIAAESLRQQQAAYDRWSQAIRRRPLGTAADFKVHPDGSVEQLTEAYGAGGKPVPLAGGASPTIAAPPKPKPTGAKVPPPVSAAPQGKTMTNADLQAYAKEHTGGDLAAAKKIFTDKGWKILP